MMMQMIKTAQRAAIWAVLAAATLVLIAPPVARADTISKANNANNLNLTTSWTGGVVPGAADIAQWTNTVTTANTTVLGAGLSWAGIKIANPGGLVTINAGNTLTNGTSGIDLSTATQDLTLNCGLVLQGAQTWDVGAGRTLTAAGIISGVGGLTKTNSGTLTLYNGNTYTGPTILNGGTLRIGTPSVNGGGGTGTGPITIMNGTIICNANYNGLNNSQYNINGNFTVASGGLSFSFSTGNVLLGGNYTITNNQQQLVISGPISDGGAGYGLTITGTGGLQLSNFAVPATSTYTGKTVVLGGNLTVLSALTYAGVPGPLGAPTGANATIDLYNGTTLQTSDSTTPKTDRTINLAGSGTGTVTIATSTGNNSGWPKYGAVTATGTGAKTLAFSYGGRYGQISVMGQIPDSADGSPLSLTVSAAGYGYSLYLYGTNTFTGSISVGTAGEGSGLYIGGSGQLGSGSYTNTIGINSINTIFYYSSSANQTLSGVISGAGALTKNGWGTLTLTGTNTYKGATTVSAGLLKVDGALGTNAVIVAAGGTLGGIGTVGGAVTNAVGTATAAGGAINLVDGAVGTLTLGSNLVFNGSATYPNSLYFDLGTNTTDMINVSGAHMAANPVGSVLVNLSQLPGGTLTPGTYTLIQGGAASTFTGYKLATTQAGGNVYSGLGADTANGKPNNLAVTVNAGVAGDSVNSLYWKGDTAVWNTAQWYSDASGSTTAASPGYNSNVRFATSSPGNLSNTLGQDYEINSLTVDSGIGATSIGGNMLTIDATSANNNTAGSGITVSNAAGTTISSKVGLAVGQTWTVGSGAALTVSGVISDFGGGYSLTKAGAGVLTNSGVNTYSGPTAISEGTLAIGGAGLLGFGAYAASITNNGAFIYSSTAAQTLSGVISGSGVLTKANSGTLTLTGPNTYTGATANNAGVLTIQNATALGTAAAGTTVASGAALQIQGDITVGAEALSLNGTGPGTGGALRNISGANVWQGTVTLAGAARINSDAGSLTFNTAANSITGTQNLTLGGAGNGTVVGTITTGTGTLTKDGAGVWTLFGANTYSGATAIGGGTLVVTSLNSVSGGTSSSSLGAPTTVPNGTIAIGSGNTAGTLTYTGSGETTDRVLSLAGTGGGVTIDQSGTGLLKFTNLAVPGAGSKTLTLQGSTAGTGEIGGTITNNSNANVTSVTKAGTGVWTLSGTNTYSGTTTVNGGTLKAGIASVAGAYGAFGTNSAVTLANTAGVVLNLNGFNTVIGSLAGGGTTGGNVTLGTGTATLTVGAKNTSTTFAGVISGTGSLVKGGTGTNTLSGVNLYTGNTTVSAGMLALGTTNSIGNTATLTIADGAMLNLTNGVTTVNALILGGKLKAKGVWGQAGNAGVTQADPSPYHFTGPGVLNVLTGVSSGTLIILF
ncbi:MAG: autotransporter-associated beta strand repeat-containing protein [bacterium]